MLYRINCLLLGRTVSVCMISIYTRIKHVLDNVKKHFCHRLSHQFSYVSFRFFCDHKSKFIYYYYYYYLLFCALDL